MKKATKKRAEGQVESFGQRMLPIAAVMFTLRRGLREFVVEAGVQGLDACWKTSERKCAASATGTTPSAAQCVRATRPASW